eukprot:377160_1
MGNDNCCGCDTHKREEYLSHDLKNQMKSTSMANNIMDLQTESVESNSHQQIEPQLEPLCIKENNDNVDDGKPFSILEITEFNHTTIDASRINSENESESNESSSDDEMNWKEYETNLNGLFYLFSAVNKNTYMSRNELKQFFDIVELNYLEMVVDDVFAMMDNNETGKIASDAFIEYFCDPQLNPKAIQIKHFIGNQVSWELLLQALNIFDEFDSDDSGMLEFDEFSLFGQKMFSLNDEEAEVLWKMVDIENSGQITIIDVFVWFKKRYEAAKQIVDDNDSDDTEEEI